ncbi:restriction endonuclease subunit S [Sphingomonas sp. VDB2]|uniref:restriction endonuclease subunit S n=1 Tax=Sphingomonas sp. VDB2 TaxID=3228751 RepID=UPI003A808382
MADPLMTTVADCLDRVAVGAAPKLTTDRYRSKGTYPIIDQGQAFIAGWTDDDRGLISDVLPLIVFGDHTRAFKYVDFPFVRGADGTQLLKPKAGIDPRYFYYACRAIPLPSRGYNRHFKQLKESTLELPGFDEQVLIGRCLNTVDNGIDAEVVILDRLDALKRAAMRELFARGLRGEAQKESEIGSVPESWEIKTLLELCTISSGGTPRKSVAEYWNGDLPWVSGKDLKKPTLDDAIDHISAEGAAAGSKIAPADAVLILVRGMGLAKDLPVARISRPMAFNQDLKALISKGEVTGAFLRSAIYNRKDALLSRIVPSAHGTMTLNLDDLESFKIGCPTDPDEISGITATLDAIDAKMDLHKRKRTLLEKLFRSLLHKLVTGEIRIADLDLTALEANQRVAA